MATLAGNGAKRGTTLPHNCGFDSRQESNAPGLTRVTTSTSDGHGSPVAEVRRRQN